MRNNSTAGGDIYTSVMIFSISDRSFKVSMNYRREAILPEGHLNACVRDGVEEREVGRHNIMKSMIAAS